jgi:hypothetical protein
MNKDIRINLKRKGRLYLPEDSRPRPQLITIKGFIGDSEHHSNALYGKGRQAFLEGGIAWLTSNIRMIFVATANYTLSIDVDQYLSSITAAARIATSTYLTNKTSTLCVADAGDQTISSVTGGVFQYIVIEKDNGAEATSPLIACIDTATGLPCTPNGGDVTVQWDSGANKIFQL